MESKQKLQMILTKYDNEIAKLYGKLLKIEKEYLNNRNDNALSIKIYNEIRGEEE